MIYFFRTVLVTNFTNDRQLDFGDEFKFSVHVEYATNGFMLGSESYSREERVLNELPEEGAEESHEVVASALRERLTSTPAPAHARINLQNNYRSQRRCTSCGRNWFLTNNSRKPEESTAIPYKHILVQTNLDKTG